MNEEIQIGEYGRTNLGRIIKFAWLESSEGERYKDKVILIKNNKVVNEFYYFSKNEYILKHSKNIIDLIEVGDIVNKGYIYEIGNAENGDRWVHNLNGLLLYNEDIKTIVTKELIENNCYRIG